MTIESILSTNLEFTGKPAFKIVNEKVYSAVPLYEIKSCLVFSHYSYRHNGFEWTEYHRTNEAANLVINDSNRKKSIRKKRTDEAATAFWTEYHRTVEAANQLVRAVNELIDPLYKENRDIEEEYRSLKSGNNSEKARPTINLTIEKLIDKSLELGSLVGLFEILSKNKQLDKKEVVKAILSRITSQKLEQLTQEKIESYSKSVDGYLGVTDAKQQVSFIRAINDKRGEIERNNKESMQRILFGDGDNNNVSKNIKIFETSIMTFLTKEEVINFLFEAKSPAEIKELNQLLPQNLRVAEVQNDVQKKEIISKALDFAGFEEGYLPTTVKPTEEEKPKTSVFGCCCTKSPVNKDSELIVDGGR